MTTMCSFDEDPRDEAKKWEEKAEMREKLFVLKV